MPADADGILAVGGGSAIDTGKYASAQSGKPVVHVPTTYSGAEWTTLYGIRSPDRVIRGGGAGAQPVAIVYDVESDDRSPGERHGGHRAERPRALRRGALRARPRCRG